MGYIYHILVFNVNISLLSTEGNVSVLLASQIQIITVKTLSSAVLPLLAACFWS